MDKARPARSTEAAPATCRLQQDATRALHHESLPSSRERLGLSAPRSGPCSPRRALGLSEAGSAEIARGQRFFLDTQPHRRLRAGAAGEGGVVAVARG